MISTAEIQVHQDVRTGHGPRYRPALLLQAMLMTLLASISGCSGCTEDPTSTAHQAEKKDKEENKKPQKPKADFDFTRVVVAPADVTTLPQSIKPGHWYCASYESKANNFDFSGSMTLGVTNNRGDLVDIDGVPYRMESTRPVALAKGQSKNLESMFFVPPNKDRTQTWVTKQLLTERTGSLIQNEMHPIEHLPSYEYDMLILANDPDRYRFLKVLDSVRPPSEEAVEGEFENLLRLHFPRTKNRAPLPSQPLAWTTTAYILWDDVDPNWLRPEQQQAMLDWLHWGGQLIISGPLSLDKLKGSFLEPYLPASFGGSQTLDQEMIYAFSDPWTVGNVYDGEAGTRLKIGKPWQGVKLDRHPEAMFMPDTGDLLVERAIGRGRIVMSAFRLNQRELLNWHSFDSIINGLLLRRTPRTYSTDQYGSLVVRLHDGQRTFDAAANTRLRYFARDGRNLAEFASNEPQATAQEELQNPFAFPHGRLLQDEISEKTKPGVAAWNDLSPVSEQARHSLREAANIEVPPREFVLMVLLGYLTVIVPLNWVVFRIIGRVEWAWIAAPIIAVATGFVVVRLANLNIGFARSKTEIAVIEAQAGYPRAHLSRYTALYTSLSSTYELHFNDPSSVAIPFPRDANASALEDQRRPTVSLAIGDGITMTGLEVPSNTTGLVHSEQMFDLGGAIDWKVLGTSKPHVVNNTKHTFSGAGIVRCRPGGGRRVIESYVIGRFEPGDDVEVAFESAGTLPSERIGLGEKIANTRSPEAINLRNLIALALGIEHLRPGETRLVAWTDAELPGVQVSPAAAQTRQAAVLMANLSYGDESKPQRDSNTRYNFKVKTFAELEAEEINPQK